MRACLAAAALALGLVGCAPAPTAPVVAPLPEAPNCPLLPADSYWYAPVADLPAHPRSDAYVTSIGRDAPTHPDFGAGLFAGGPIGIDYTTVPGDQPRVPVTFTFAEESDPGPYPIPPDAPIEGGPDSDGDRHVLVVDRDACVLYEMFAARRQPDGTWHAGSGAVFDLRSHALRPEGWTSADAAGLPILPGLTRYDEVASGRIGHALRVTVPASDRSYVWPARHQAGSADDPSLPPMGLRLRLRPDRVDPASFPPQARVIVAALLTYGAIVADNGSPWFLSGVPDDRWDNTDLRALRDIPGSAWEAVDATVLQVSPDSAQVVPAGGGRATGRLAGATRVETAVQISRRAFPAGAPVVYLARADGFADAVAGGTLTDGPVLLVPSCGTLPAAVAAEIERLDPAEVVALGGPGAVCEDLLEQAASR